MTALVATMMLALMAGSAYAPRAEQHSHHVSARAHATAAGVTRS